eukprot:gene8667-biopygen9183
MGWDGMGWRHLFHAHSRARARTRVMIQSASRALIVSVFLLPPTRLRQSLQLTARVRYGACRTRLREGCEGLPSSSCHQS